MEILRGDINKRDSITRTKKWKAWHRNKKKKRHYDASLNSYRWNIEHNRVMYKVIWMHNPPLQPLHHQDACNPETGSNILFLLFPSRRRGGRRRIRVFENFEAVFHRATCLFTEPVWYPDGPLSTVLLSRNSRATMRVWRATGSPEIPIRNVYTRDYSWRGSERRFFPS